MSTIRPVGTKMKCCKCFFEWVNTHKTIKKCPDCQSKEFAHPIMNNLKGEEWRKSRLHTKHEVSNYGRVRRLIGAKGTYAGMGINGTVNYDGYVRITGIFFHILVANEFLGEKPKGYECNHIDGNKLNNHISNLEYITHAENMRHAGATGLMASGEKAGRAKLKSEDIYKILSLKKQGLNHPTMAKLFNIDQSIISRIVNGLSWKKENMEYANQNL